MNFLGNLYTLIEIAINHNADKEELRTISYYMNKKDIDKIYESRVITDDDKKSTLANPYRKLGMLFGKIVPNLHKFLHIAPPINVYDYIIPQKKQEWKSFLHFLYTNDCKTDNIVQKEVFLILF